MRTEEQRREARLESKRRYNRKVYVPNPRTLLTPEERAQRQAEARKAWKERNPDSQRLHRSAYRARKRNADTRVIAAKDLARLHAQPCAACGTTEDLQVDHVIPLARGGRHAIGNLQMLCRTHNQQKLDLLQTEWKYQMKRRRMAA